MELSAHATEILKGLKKVAQSSLDEAFTVPPAIYSDAEIAKLELARIFRTDWLCPGLAADIPNPGDYVTWNIAGQPIYCVRGRDGGIRSFANVCLHRMMTLLQDRGNCQRITCPYHGWTYDIDGRVIGAGHMQGRDPEFEKKGYRLPEIRTEIWEGWIYVTLNDEAPPVAELLRELEPEVARYRLDKYVSVALQDHLWNTNWKLLTENFMEGYHLPVAHRETVGAWFPVEATKFPEKVFDAFTWQTFEKDETAKYGRAHPDNTHLEGQWRYTSLMPTVFPSHMYVLAPDHMWYLSLHPKDVDHVHVRFGLARGARGLCGDLATSFRSGSKQPWPSSTRSMPKTSSWWREYTGARPLRWQGQDPSVGSSARFTTLPVTWTAVFRLRRNLRFRKLAAAWRDGR